MTDDLDANREDLARGLQHYIARAVPEWPGARVGELRTISRGWESDVYALDLAPGAAPDTPRELVLRLYPGAVAVHKATHEFTTMQRLHAAGFPVPLVYWLEPDPAALGRPFVLMEWIAGPSLEQSLRGADQATRERLLERMMALLVRLHRLDWRALVADPSAYAGLTAAGESIGRTIARWRELLASAGLAGFVPLCDWLLERAALQPPAPLAPLHFDWHGWNILLRASDGEPIVIDWTSFEVGDPRFDLAWTAVIYWGSRWPLREELVGAYARAAGTPRAVEGFDYFLVAACLRRLAVVVASCLQGSGTLGMRDGAEELMRGQARLLSGLYDHLTGQTGLRVPEAEQLLAGWG